MRPERTARAMDKDELELVALEIGEVKTALRELSQQVLRIERQLKAVLPSPQAAAKSYLRPRVDSDAVIVTLERLTEAAKNNEQIENELRRMTVKRELAMLARELGMTNTKLPPKDELVRRISTRLRQRASVTSGIHDSVRKRAAL